MLRLLRYLKPYRRYIILAGALIFLQLGGELALPALMNLIVNQGVEKGNFSLIYTYGAVMAGIAVLSVFVAIAIRRLINKVSVYYAYDMRGRIFDKTLSLSFSEFNAIGNAGLQTRATADANFMTEMINWMFRIFTLPVLFVGGIIFALSVDVKLTAVSLVAVPFILIVLFGVSRLVKPLMEVAHYHQDKSLLILRERMTGLRVIRAFGKEEYEHARFKKQVRIMSSNFIRNNSMQGSVFPLLGFINNIVILLLLWFGSRFIADGGVLTTSGIMAVIQYVNMIISAIVGMSWIIVMMPMLSTSGKRIHEVLDAQGENLGGISPAEKLSGGAEMRNLTFTFDKKAAEPVLKDINMIFERGKTTAILGGTGSGKSTLARLLLKFYTPTEGTLSFDGRDINELGAEYLRECIAYIPQNPVIFRGTLRDNVLLGNFSATEQEIVKALETAQLGDFVRSHEAGINYEINESGKNLSGGQKQRLSIARALVRDANMIIFDDSFSALDYATDLKLRAALRENYPHKTKIIITQRVATALSSDMIYVLEKGQITASGTHENLLKASETYKQLAKLQMNLGGGEHE